MHIGDIISKNEKQQATDLTTGSSKKLNRSSKKLKENADVKMTISDTDKGLNDRDTNNHKEINRFGKRKRSCDTIETNVSQSSDAMINSRSKNSKKQKLSDGDLESTTTPSTKILKKIIGTDIDNKSVIPSDAKSLVTKKLKKKKRVKDDNHKSVTPSGAEISLTKKIRKSKGKDIDNDSSSLHAKISKKFSNDNNDKAIESQESNLIFDSTIKKSKGKKNKALKKNLEIDKLDTTKPSTTRIVGDDINSKETISKREVASKDTSSVGPAISIDSTNNGDRKGQKKLSKSKKAKAIPFKEDPAITPSSATRNIKSTSKEGNKAIDTLISSRSGVVAIKKQRPKKEIKDKSVFNPDYLTDGDRIGTGGDIKWE